MKQLKEETLRKLDEARKRVIIKKETKQENIDDYIMTIQVAIDNLTEMRDQLISEKENGAKQVPQDEIKVEFILQDKCTFPDIYTMDITYTEDNKTNVLIKASSVPTQSIAGKYRTLTITLYNNKNMTETVNVRFDTTNIIDNIAKGVIGRRMKI